MELKYADGLIPAIIQDHQSGKVLMLGFMNDEAYKKTLESGFVTFYSRSRKKLWMKGETSGHRQTVRAIHVDCDGDAILLRVPGRRRRLPRRVRELLLSTSPRR